MFKYPLRIGSVKHRNGLVPKVFLKSYAFGIYDDKTTTETQYYLSSLEVEVKATARHIWQHWDVENKVPWVLDISFREDESRIRRSDGAEIMGMIPRFCMNLAQLNPTKNSMKGKT